MSAPLVSSGGCFGFGHHLSQTAGVDIKNESLAQELLSKSRDAT